MNDDSANAERRQHQRYSLDLLKMWGLLPDRERRIENVSESGISYVTDEPHEPGATVHFTHGQERIAIKVLYCDPVPGRASEESTQYRVRGRFANKAGSDLVYMLMKSESA